MEADVKFQDLIAMRDWLGRARAERGKRRNDEGDEVAIAEEDKRETGLIKPLTTVQPLRKSFSLLADDTYDVVFKSAGKLGLVLRKKKRRIIVEKVKGGEGYGVIEVGDSLVSINDDFVRRVSFKSVVQLLTQLPRPLKLSFCRGESSPDRVGAGSSMADGSGRRRRSSSGSTGSRNNGKRASTGDANVGRGEDGSVYTLKFVCPPHVGTGISVVPSPCGNVPMVSQIDKGIFNYSVGSSSSVALGGDARGIEVVNEEKEFVSYETGEGDGHFALEGGRYHGRDPNPGAVIIAIDDVLAVDLGYSEVAKILSTGDKKVGSFVRLLRGPLASQN